MDSMNFDWLDNEKSIIDSLASSAPMDTPDTANDILQYLLQEDGGITSDMNTADKFMPAIQPEPQSQMTDKPASKASAEFRSKLSIVQSKDNFVTFTPLNDLSKKSTVIKKTKFKEPIFVTESPQNSYKKKKKSNVPQSNNSSGEENSDDDMLLDQVLSSSSNLKKMTSKERRQIRNKISARNFRVRRKEYITQLEEKVEEHEKTIETLKEENSKLRTANEEIMKQVLNQPITPPSSDEFLSSSSSSGSEGHQSPETGPVPSMFQFQLNDLYDFNLFDQQQQQQQQRQQDIIDSNNLFYLNHAVMPDWDIHQVLGEKGRPVSSEETQRQLSRELISDYPLLAPALMSIVIRHTLSLEYVTSLAKEFAETTGANLNQEVRTDSITKKKSLLKLEQSKDDQEKLNDKEDDEERLTDEEFLQSVLLDYFPSYVLWRARGKSHEQTIARFRECSDDKNSRCHLKMQQKSAKKERQANSTKPQSKLSTLQTYCKVAGTLLRHPHQMAHVRNVLKEEIPFAQNKYTSKIENNYTSLINPFKNLRIAGSSK